MTQELISRIKFHFKFSLKEQKQIILSAAIFGFILSFRMWGVQEFNLKTGLNNWFFSAFAITVVMACNISAQKVFALREGYKMHYSWWFPGVLIGLFLTFVSYGFIPFIFPGTAFFEHKKNLRLGQFRHGSNNKDFAEASVAGVFTNIFLAMILGFVYLSNKSFWTMFFIKINFFYAFFSMLPLPKLSGIRMGEGATAGFYVLFFNRILYVFLLATLIAYSALIYSSIAFFGSFSLLIVALVMGLIVMFLFMKYSERSF